MTMTLVAANDDPGFEIRRENRTKPAVLAVVIAAIVAVVLVRDPGGSFEEDPVTTTLPISEQTVTSADPTTTSERRPTSEPTGEVPIRGVSTRNTLLYVFGTRAQSLASSEASGMILPAAPTAIATAELLAVIDFEGALRVAGDDSTFRSVACCFTGIVASREPRHLWALDDDVAVLLDLDRGTASTRLPLGGERVIGTGRFGLVTVDDGADARWHRPGLEPTIVTVPDGRIPVSAGGEVVLYLVSGSSTVEARRIDDGALIRSFLAERQGSVAATLSTDGRAVAVTGASVTTVFDVDTGALLGSIETEGGRPVAVGEGRFAAIVGTSVRDSTGRNFPHFADPVVLATRAE